MAIEPLSLLLFSLLAAPALAADPPTAPALPAQPSFGSSIDVRVVNVEAVVTNRKGERVRGLAARDFRVLVDGKEVPIDYFTEVESGQAASPPQAAASGGETPSAPAPAAMAAPGEAVGTNYLVYIDDQLSIAALRNQTLKRLAADLGRLGPHDRMAVLSFDGHKINRLSDWTGDRKVLARVLAEAQERPTFGLLALAGLRSEGNDRELVQKAGPETRAFEQGQERSSSDKLAERPSGGDDPELAQEPSLPTMSLGGGIGLGIRAVVAAMRGTPAPAGRRVMLLLNGPWGFTEPPPPDRGAPSAFNVPEPEKIFAAVYETANLLGYTLYTVELHGMMLDSWNDAGSMGPVSHDFITTDFERSVHDSLEVMARETGGKAMLNSARLNAFERVTADTSAYYWLGFTPQWRADGRHHDVRVEVRRPGLAVRSRSGFSDLSRETEAQVQAESRLLYGSTGADRPLLVTPGALRRLSMLKQELPVTVEVPADALVPQVEEGTWTLTGTLSIVVLDKNGENPRWQTLPVRFSANRLPPAGAKSSLQARLKLPRSARKVIFALGGEHGEVRAWTQLDLGKVGRE
ncbi:MAG TPA: VWA domain-containing protein [Thermoanaerobaculia bacterium]|nr:VWA domain-containing protein [Thermoanaerobaculia bacterium]